MLWHQIWLVFRWISIYRWNNFPRIENVSSTDNLAFSLHTMMLLASVLEEKEWIKVNLGYIFKKSIFESFDTFILSDINSDVQNRIKSKNPKIFEELEQKVYNFTDKLELPERIRADAQFIYQNKKSKEFELENKLSKFVKLWVAYYEAYFNAKIYSEIFQPILKNIEEQINNHEYELFLKYINIDKEENDFKKYLLNIRRLQFNYRWNSRKRMFPISVMSHLFICFYLAYLIGNLEDRKDDEIEYMMKIALFHDIPEAITWDILTPTKKAVTWFEELLSEVEEDMVEEYLLCYVNNYKFKDGIKKFILKPWEWELWKMVKLADIFCALFEAKIEKNEEFNYKKIKKTIHGLPFKSIDYLLKFWVDYFDEDIEDVIHL